MMLPPFCSRMSQRSSGLPSQVARRFLLVVAEGVERIGAMQKALDRRVGDDFIGAASSTACLS
jgi:hypothetical protein